MVVEGAVVEVVIGLNRRHHDRKMRLNVFDVVVAVVVETVAVGVLVVVDGGVIISVCRSMLHVSDAQWSIHCPVHSVPEGNSVLAFGQSPVGISFQGLERVKNNHQQLRNETKHSN